MHLDLRYPIGLLLTTYGVILAVQGAMVDAKVLNLNVNLYWGATMTVVCGAVVVAAGAVWLAARDASSWQVRVEEGMLSGTATSDGRVHIFQSHRIFDRQHRMTFPGFSINKALLESAPKKYQRIAAAEVTVEAVHLFAIDSQLFAGVPFGKSIGLLPCRRR